MVNRDELVENYVAFSLQNMDLEDVYQLAAECLDERLGKLSDGDLLDVVGTFAPVLLEEIQ